jgi:hypothetical protein
MLLPVGIFVSWRNPIARILVLPLAAAFFIVLCIQTLVWERWALPLLPLGAIMIAATSIGVRKALRLGAARAMLLAITLLIAAPLLVRAQADARARLHDTRQAATAWAQVHVPPGSTVLIEHFAFDLISEPWDFLFPVGDAGCVDAIGFLRGKKGYGTIDQARGGRANLDFGTMAPERRADCRPDFAILTEYERYARERAAFPVEYAAYRELLARGTVVARFQPEAGVAGGKTVLIVRFDRPRMGPRR